MSIDFKRLRNYLNDFRFTDLFVEELGWNAPPSTKITTLAVGDDRFEQRPVAELAGAVVLELAAADGSLPDAKTRVVVHKHVSQQHFENLLIFVDKRRTQSLWYWVRREGDKYFPRDHLFVKGQPGGLFLSKLSDMVFDLKDFDEEGEVPLVEVANRLKRALDVERTTKKFYREFQEQHLAFLELIEGIPDERKRRWYASVLLNRVMFIYFLQRKGFIDGGKLNYLQDKFAFTKRENRNYFEDFLKPLFFEGFARPAEHRSDNAQKLLGNIKYLDGGLFLEHPVEKSYPDIRIPNEAFDNLLSLFGRYSWNLDDTPGGKDDEINPDVLGYIFEKYINQKAFGAYYTRPEITQYLCEQTINRLILEAVNLPNIPGLPPQKHFSSVPELLVNLDARLCRQLLLDVLPKLSLLDPACGSGAFLVAALHTLINIYSAIIGKIQFVNDPTLNDWYKKVQHAHPSISYFIKKSIITHNLFGVDIMEEAVEIAKLRLFLALVASAETVDQLEPLPNIDFNILTGNSLIGLMRVDPAAFDKKGADGSVQQAIFGSRYEQVVQEKNRLIASYRHATMYSEDLAALRDNIREKKQETYDTLNAILLDEFERHGIRFEQATWDETKSKLGKPKKRALTKADIEALTPFHWGYEFDHILNVRGGFDAIITNPPWDIFKPQAKEFFQEHSDLVTKNKMTIKEFEKEQEKLLKNPEVRAAWLAYLSSFPHVSAYYRSSPQYVNQISHAGGRKVGSDINLYKLFTEQGYNLLREGGECGIVIPSGIYTDLGSKQLREMLFSQTQIGGLFCFENRREIFENVHRSFKIVVLTFEKGGNTEKFPAAFMRHNVEELEHFPKQIGLTLSVDLIRRLSPDSLSVMEFKNELDLQIIQKMAVYPLLGEKIEGTWNFSLGNEFHMTNSSHLFEMSAGPGRLSLYEGKMIHQFTHLFSDPRYWVDEERGRRAILGKRKDLGQTLGYQKYRLGYRSVAASTNERTMIATVLPQKVFFGHSINAVEDGLANSEMIFAVAMLNSFIVDYLLRASVSQNLTMSFIYQLPIPRLTKKDPAFAPIVHRAARLICTTPEFDDLAAEVGLGSHENGATDAAERARLRAELDGLVAHLYGLTEEEFAYVLTTFPLVDHSVKDAALAAYRAFAPNPDDAMVVRLIQDGENERVEFKVAALVNPHGGNKDDKMKSNVVESVAAFMNSYEGGTLLIGVANDGRVMGLSGDFQAANPQKANWDGYERWLTDALSNGLGPANGRYYSLSRHHMDEQVACRISVRPADAPVYVKGDLHVRDGGGKRKLSAQEAATYIRRRWGHGNE